MARPTADHVRSDRSSGRNAKRTKFKDYVFENQDGLVEGRPEKFLAEAAKKAGANVKKAHRRCKRRRAVKKTHRS